MSLIKIIHPTHKMLYTLCLFLTLFLLPLQARSPETILKKLHSELSLLHGSLKEEYEEQKMAALFIKPTDYVLELGSNVGRNSCIIARLLDNPAKTFVTVEPHPENVRKLLANKKHNRLAFHVENGAISTKPCLLISHTPSIGARTTPYYRNHTLKVPTLTYQALKQKYHIDRFNTLVADCEGALYHILKEDDSILDDVTTIITENDYATTAHFHFVESKFLAKGFRLAYTRPLSPPTFSTPLNHIFYQTYQK